jgi:hypothetical protein
MLNQQVIANRVATDGLHGLTRVEFRDDGEVRTGAAAAVRVHA